MVPGRSPDRPEEQDHAALFESVIAQLKAKAITVKTGKRIAQERSKLALAHLARSKGELAVLDRTEPADVAIDLHVVGRIGEDKVGLLAPHQGLEVDMAARVAAQEPVPIELPEIALSRDGSATGKHDGVFGLIAALGISLTGFVDDEVNLGKAEPGELDLEVEFNQRLEPIARISRSHPALSASLLSAST